MQVREKSKIRLRSPLTNLDKIVVYDLHEPFQSCLQGCSRYHPEMKQAHKKFVKNLLNQFPGSDHVVLSVSKDLPELSEAFDIWARYFCFYVGELYLIYFFLDHFISLSFLYTHTHNNNNNNNSTLDASRSQTFLETISSQGDRVLTTCQAVTQLFQCILRCNRTCKNARYDHTLPALGLGILEQTVRLVPSRARRLVSAGERLRKRLNNLLGQNGILVVPSLLCPAPRHHENILRIMTTGHTGIFNVTQLPATAIPTGFSKFGLPLGLQIVASEGNDGLCFKVASSSSRSYYDE